MDRERQIKAASELEELVPALKETINKLREGQSGALAYALVYELRKRVSYVVRDMGRSGSPEAEHQRRACEIIDAQIWLHSSREGV